MSGALAGLQQSLDGGIPGLTVVINGLLHLLLVAAMWLFVVSAIKEVANTRHEGEKRMKTLALFAGALIVVASQASGTSYADLILDSLGGAKPLTFGLLGVVGPAAAGVGIAWYFVNRLNRGEVFATRILLLVGMLAVTQFAVMYGVAVGDRGFELGQSATPNVSFVLGLFLYMLLKYDPSNRSARGSLARNVGRRMTESARARPPAGES